MKKLIYTALAVASVLPLTGCSDFLDAENRKNGGQDFNKFAESDPSVLRATAYNDLRALATVISMTDEQADLYIDARAANDGDFATFNVNPETKDVTDYYQNCYAAINHANALVHYAGADTQLGAEGRFLRDLVYYFLTQQYGAVPYVDYYVDTAERDYPRTPLSDLYPALLADLTDLYNNSQLPAVSAHNGVASKQAAAALAAKIALAAAWDLDTELISAEQGTYNVKSTSMFATAADWAEKAINGVQLTMSFADKWSPYNEGNAEEIFSVQYDRLTYPGDKETGGHSLQNDYLAYYGNCVVTGMKGTGSGGRHGMSQKSLGLWEKGDTRFDATFMTTMYNPISNDLAAKWPKIGYLAPWVCTQTELEAQPLGMRFYPQTATREEVEADLRKFMETNKDKKLNQLIAPTEAEQTANKWGINQPFAAILGPETVTVWHFNSNGTIPEPETLSFNQFYVQQSANGGTCVKKWDDPESGNVIKDQDYRDIPLLHVSEMYLTAAEAYLLAGQESKALEKVNAVRARAGVATLSSFSAYETPYVVSANFEPTALDMILDERARETYAERTRWLDIRRTKQMVRYNLNFSRAVKTVAAMSNAEGEIKWYKPIPQKEIQNNIGISDEDQNPGY